MTALLILAKSGVSAALNFLRGASAWQLIAIGLACFAVVQHFTIVRAHHEAAKWEKVAAQYKVQLDSISTAKNVQKQVSTVTVEKVIQGQRTVQKVVQVIHDAPNPPDCKTPAIDQLRSAV